MSDSGSPLATGGRGGGADVSRALPSTTRPSSGCGIDEKPLAVRVAQRAACSSSPVAITAPAPLRAGSAATVRAVARLVGPSAAAWDSGRCAPVNTMPPRAGPAIRSVRKAVSSTESTPWVTTTPVNSSSARALRTRRDRASWVETDVSHDGSAMTSSTTTRSGGGPASSSSSRPVATLDARWAMTSPVAISRRVTARRLREDLAQEGLRPFVLWVGDHVAGGALLDHHAAVHEDQCVAHLSGEAHLVGDHDHGHAVLRQLAHDRQDLADQFWVQG